MFLIICLGGSENDVEDSKRKHETERKGIEKRAVDLQESVRILEKELREKKQENRIYLLKRKELKRAMKHNQLRPLRNSAIEPTSDRIPLKGNPSARKSVDYESGRR